MEFGIFLTMPSPDACEAAQVYRRGLEMATRAEELDFSRIWLAEHHFSTYSYISRPLLLLAHLAGKTSRIRLGTAIVPLPLHNPLLVAEEIAVVDVLSGGRVELGIGKGYQRYQFDRLGVTKDGNDNRYREAIQVLQRALSEDTFSHSGEYFNIPETTLVPRPVQQPMPVWLVVNTGNREEVEFALLHGMNLFTGVLEPLNRLTRPDLTYPELFEQFRPRYIGTQRPVFVSYDADEIERAVEHVRWNARVSVSQRRDFGEIKKGKAIARELPGEPATEEILENYVVMGTPERCIRQLKRLQSGLGCNYFSASFWFGALDHASVMASMELFAAEVMPAFSTQASAKPTGTLAAGEA
ncbi:MAG TPA: LLM class flavin-dependent oxidoreductase [Pyrinomonadaceae bacterium]|nr:LLM class flavin-dependent oxidoreductase [Pyrinomonadaceae bacterium]